MWKKCLRQTKEKSKEPPCVVVQMSVHTTIIKTTMADKLLYCDDPDA